MSLPIKLIFITLFSLLLVSVLPQPIAAQGSGQRCGDIGQCDPGFTCNMNTLTCIPSTQDVDTSIGRIDTPPGVDKFTGTVVNSPSGIVVFASNILKFVTIIAGIWTLINFALASLTYISASGANVHEKVQNKLTLSILGLILIVMSYTVAGVIGLIFFGDAGFILNPKIPTAPN